MNSVGRLKRLRKQHTEISMDPVILAHVAAQRPLWRDSEAEAAREEAHQMELALLMRWVRREMGRRLTRREQRLVEQHYFRALTLQQVAHRNKVHYTTVSRSLRRAVGKLRTAARETAGSEPLRQAVLQAMAEEECRG